MMTETIAPADSQATRSPRLARPETDGAALRAIEDATAHIRERALQIRQNPEEHKPRLVLSQHVRGTSLLELSIMISLQVSANRAQAASDRRAIADHETLIALHEMAKQQLDILNGQDRVLAILDNFASKDMPGRQAHIQDCVNQILAKVDPKAAAG
jgi:hypothetical protein